MWWRKIILTDILGWCHTIPDISINRTVLMFFYKCLFTLRDNPQLLIRTLLFQRRQWKFQFVLNLSLMSPTWIFFFLILWPKYVIKKFLSVSVVFLNLFRVSACISRIKYWPPFIKTIRKWPNCTFYENFVNK